MRFVPESGSGIAWLCVLDASIPSGAWERGQMLEFLAAVRTQPARHRVA